MNNKEHFPLIMIDKRSYLEVADIPTHRYAKNLRAYFQIYPGRQIIENNVRIFKQPFKNFNTDCADYFSFFIPVKKYSRKFDYGRMEYLRRFFCLVEIKNL